MTNAERSRRVLVLAVGILGLVVAPAAAQQGGRFSVGAGAGVALPLHGDYDFTARAWQADLRFDTAKHFAIGVFFEEWRHTEEDVRTDQTIVGPTGPLGRIARVELRTEFVTRAVGWNFLGKAPLGRVNLYGGGGVSMLLFTRDYSQTVTGCETTQPGACANFSNSFNNSAFSIQVQGGGDVAVTSHVAVMGEFRTILPIEDIGAGHMSLTGGVRFRF